MFWVIFKVCTVWMDLAYTALGKNLHTTCTVAVWKAIKITFQWRRWGSQKNGSLTNPQKLWHGFAYKFLNWTEFPPNRSYISYNSASFFNDIFLFLVSLLPSFPSFFPFSFFFHIAQSLFMFLMTNRKALTGKYYRKVGHVWSMVWKGRGIWTWIISFCRWTQQIIYKKPAEIMFWWLCYMLETIIGVVSAWWLQN